MVCQPIDGSRKASKVDCNSTSNKVHCGMGANHNDVSKEWHWKKLPPKPELPPGTKVDNNTRNRSNDSEGENPGVLKNVIRALSRTLSLTPEDSTSGEESVGQDVRPRTRQDARDLGDVEMGVLGTTSATTSSGSSVTTKSNSEESERSDDSSENIPDDHLTLHPDFNLLDRSFLDPDEEDNPLANFDTVHPKICRLLGEKYALLQRKSGVDPLLTKSGTNMFLFFSVFCFFRNLDVRQIRDSKTQSRYY